MTFEEPLWFLLLIFIPVLVFWDLKNQKKLFIPLSGLKAERSFALLRMTPLILRCLALFMITCILARPTQSLKRANDKVEGIDIMIVIDASGSMRAQDFQLNGKRPNRLEVVKVVLSEFIQNRPDDRIGLVVFGTETFTQAPLTLDHEVLIQLLDNVEIGVAGEATAIGDGLGLAVNRLKDLPAKQKIIILMSDGSSNAGKVDPLVAAEAAKKYHMKVYSIGVGGSGQAPIMKNGQMYYIDADLDEETLKKISEMTDGQYFRAKDTSTLEQVYKTIDKLEKTSQKTPRRRLLEEQFEAFAWIALVILSLELLFNLTKFRKIPV